MRPTHEIGRQIGKALTEFRRFSNEFQWQLQEEMRKLEQDVGFENTAASPNITAIKPPLATAQIADSTGDKHSMGWYAWATKNSFALRASSNGQIGSFTFSKG